MDDVKQDCLKGVLVEMLPDFEHKWQPIRPEPHYEPEDSDSEE